MNKAAPFIKWAGGKRGIIQELISRLPKEFKNYFEPFVGGGALFFEINHKAENTFLSDSNVDLITTYNVIKDDPVKLITLLKKHAKNHSEKYYYKIRSKYALQNSIEIAARFIYLNKTCFNGLYRVNKKGEFNAAIGKCANPSNAIIQEDNLLACSLKLKDVTIQSQQFDQIMAKKGDFIYFDPPYYPVKPDSFTAYSKSKFTEQDQIRLANFCKQLHERKIYWMVSNSDTGFIHELFNDEAFHINIINAPRSLSRDSSKRGIIQELIITNY